MSFALLTSNKGITDVCLVSPKSKPASSPATRREGTHLCKQSLLDQLDSTSQPVALNHNSEGQHPVTGDFLGLARRVKTGFCFLKASCNKLP